MWQAFYPSHHAVAAAAPDSEKGPRLGVAERGNGEGARERDREGEREMGETKERDKKVRGDGEMEARERERQRQTDRDRERQRNERGGGEMGKIEMRLRGGSERMRDRKPIEERKRT